MNDYRKAPTLLTVREHVVNRPGFEAITNTLYDFQSYPAAGANTLSFFTSPQSSGRTRSDTNMQLAGQIPAKQAFLITGLEVYFYPSTPTVVDAMPAAFGAQAIADQVNDEYIFRRSGSLTLTIGSKDYLEEAPLSRFPQKVNFSLNAALADVTTAGANLQSRIAFGQTRGKPYSIIPVALEANQNFRVNLSWPEGPQAISNDARIGVVLDGVLFRQSQ